MAGQKYKPPVQVLSIDFDYWVPEPLRLDMGHREQKLFIDALWQIRAAQYLAKGEDLRETIKITADNSGLLPSSLPSRLCRHFGRQVNVAIAESHASLYYFLDKLTNLEIVNLDAHHDCGYTSSMSDKVECDNWAAKLASEGRLKRFVQVYPSWKSNENTYGGEAVDFIANRPAAVPFAEGWIGWDPKVFEGFKFTHIFLCRSGAWVPPWLDVEFASLAMVLEAHSRLASMYTFKNPQEFIRQFHWDDVTKGAEVYKEQMAKWERDRGHHNEDKVDR